MQDNGPLQSLMEGIQYRSRDYVSKLLPSAGAFINNKDATRKNQTPLHFAISIHREDMVRLLLDQPNIDVNIYVKSGHTNWPVYREAMYLHQAFGFTTQAKACGNIATLLITHVSFHVNIQDDKGHLPLHIAVEKGYGPYITALLQQRGDIPT